MTFTSEENQKLTNYFLFGKRTWSDIAKEYAILNNLFDIENECGKLQALTNRMQKMGRRFVLEIKEIEKKPILQPIIQQPKVDINSYQDQLQETEVQAPLEVEEIVTTKSDAKGKKMYLVEWKNYAETTWMYEKELSKCRDVLEEFQKTI